MQENKVQKSPNPNRIKRVRDVVEKRQAGLIVVIEDLYDPHNAQAIFRTCDAYGIQNIYLVFGKQQPWSPRSFGKGSSATANKWLDFKKFRSMKECIKSLKKDGYTVIATVLSDKAVPLTEAKLTDKKIAVLFGNEHKGLSSDAIEMADKHITVPMQGMVQSLNISVSAGVILYEILRQRAAAGKNYTLSKKEKAELEQSLIKRL